MIPNRSLDFSYVILNFWPNLSLAVFIDCSYNKKACILKKVATECACTSDAKVLTPYESEAYHPVWQ